MNIQMLKDYFQEFIDGKQHKIMFLNRKKNMFEEFKVIDAINLLEEKDKEIERLNKERSKTYENGLNYFLELQHKKDEIERLNNIIKSFEEELERESNMKYEYTDLEYNTFIDIRGTLKTVLKRFRELKGSDKEWISILYLE